ncbi:hypothetical protein B7P34_00935 [Streptosporangium nondiastaticum]|uniref:Regulatory protein n=1 Tax=Streptosporangium nondiastaticum TaxID=35764 RepID=A0A9X7JVM4_9ACTN|nr:hypothetical protein [Streptosporangium nondiastaticum]PSJ30605.1 hypothetical protein B7P34_00935 [Streptosporangium nondiastaticum]
MPDIATSLTDQYAARVTADIERVSQEREQVRAEISALQQRLGTLESDHQQLLKLRATLTGEPVAPVAAVEPSPSGTAAEPEEAGKKAGAKVPRPRSSQPPARARADRRGKKAAPGEATWGEVLLSYLAEQQGPQSVAEITNGVSAAHPARTVQATVVRNTLEALVARGKVQRSKQARSVAYSMAPRQGGAAQPEQKQEDVKSSKSA